MRWDDEFKKRLLKTKDYKEFLTLFNTYQGNYPKKLSYAEMARRCDFSSRSYPRELMSGRRRLTPNSLNKLIKGLKLKKTWADYLKALASLENEDIKQIYLKSYDSSEKLKTLRHRLEKQLLIQDNPSSRTKAKAFMSIKDAQAIHAALGTRSDGANLQDISLKTGISESLLLSRLDKLEEQNVVEKKGEHYFAKDLLHRFDKMDANQIFSSWFSTSINKLHSMHNKQLKSHGCLKTSAVFSIRKQDTNKLFSRLKAALEEIMTDFEDERGEDVINIVLGSFKEKDAH